MAFSFRKFIKGIRVVPESSSTSSESGDLEVDSASGKLKYYNASQSTQNSPVVTENHQQTLTLKTLTSPVINTATADTITGISGGPLTAQSVSNQDLILKSQGTGKVTVFAAGSGVVEVKSNFAFSRSAPTNTDGALALPDTVYALISANVNTISAGVDAQVLILTNTSSSYVKIENEFSAGGSGIRTGTGGSIQLDPKASLILIYNSTSPGYWHVVGGVGGSPIVLFANSGTVSVGDVVYYNNTTIPPSIQRLDAADDAKVEFIGVALDTGGGAIRVQVGSKVSVPSASISGGSFTVGKPVFANPSSAGKLTSTVPSSAGQWVIPVGIAVSSTEMIINGAGSATAVKLTSGADPFIYAAVRAVSTTQNLVSGDTIVLATSGGSGITLTLPSPIAGKIYSIKKVDAGVGEIGRAHV